MKEKLQAITPRKFMWNNRIAYMIYDEEYKRLKVCKTRKAKFTEDEANNFIQLIIKTFEPLGFKLKYSVHFRCGGAFRSYRVVHDRVYYIEGSEWQELADYRDWHFDDWRDFIEIELEIKKE